MVVFYLTTEKHGEWIAINSTCQESHLDHQPRLKHILSYRVSIGSTWSNAPYYPTHCKHTYITMGALRKPWFLSTIVIDCWSLLSDSITLGYIPKQHWVKVTNIDLSGHSQPKHLPTHCRLIYIGDRAVQYYWQGSVWLGPT